MQSYTEIPSSQSLQSSLALLLNNDKTALSNSSGSAFPTSNLQVGMTCFRTDQNKLYILKDATPTWSMIWDFNAPAVTQGADIGGGVDLNSMTVTGWYHQNSNANASGGTNYPAAKAGLLKVHADGVMTYQQYQTYDSASELYFRSCYNGTWSSWRKVITLDNDGSGSGLDADTLDGMQSGNADGSIPVSNGTVNTNLNADMVDGRHAGNASGNVPLSNGTVNTNLNADMLDGFHASSFVRTIQGVAPDASGNVVVDLASKVSKSGDTMTGDLTIYRAATPTTGVVFLGNSGARYLYYDGTNYNMPGAELIVNGSTVHRAVGGALTQSGATVSLPAVTTAGWRGSSVSQSGSLYSNTTVTVVNGIYFDAYGRVSSVVTGTVTFPNCNCCG